MNKIFVLCRQTIKIKFSKTIFNNLCLYNNLNFFAVGKFNFNYTFNYYVGSSRVYFRT